MVSNFGSFFFGCFDTILAYKKIIWKNNLLYAYDSHMPSKWLNIAINFQSDKLFSFIVVPQGSLMLEQPSSGDESFSTEVPNEVLNSVLGHCLMTS